MVDPVVARVTRDAKIVDYLEARGVEVLRVGSGFKCKCPLPGHDDRTPSFYVRVMPDGGEVFRCWGCGRKGGIVSLIRIIEGGTNGGIIRRLAEKQGVKLGRLRRDDGAEIRVEPVQSDVDALFSEEDYLVGEASSYVQAFISTVRTEDAVNKATMFYRRLDEARGDDDRMHELFEDLKRAIQQYDYAGDSNEKKENN